MIVCRSLILAYRNGSLFFGLSASKLATPPFSIDVDQSQLNSALLPPSAFSPGRFLGPALAAPTLCSPHLPSHPPDSLYPNIFNTSILSSSDRRSSQSQNQTHGHPEPDPRLVLQRRQTQPNLQPLFPPSPASLPLAPPNPHPRYRRPIHPPTRLPPSRQGRARSHPPNDPIYPFPASFQ